MKRYFFHTRCGDELIEDIDGVELPDFEAAEREARVAAREMVADLVITGGPIGGQSIDIHDDEGRLLKAVPFISVFDID